MNILDNEKLIGLEVETKNGHPLGKLASFEIDVDSHHIITYKVKHRGLVEGLFKDYLFIRRSQVISIDEEKMIVEDNILEEAAREKAQTARKSAPKEVPVIQSKLK